MPAAAVPDVLTEGDPAEVARILRGVRDAGADRVVVTLVAGDWYRQAELLADAVRMV